MAISAAAAVMLLLVGSARAGAEGTDPVGAVTAAAAEAPAPVQATPSSSPEPATAVVEDAEPAQTAEHEVTADVPSESVAEDAPAPLPSADPASTEAANPPPVSPTPAKPAANTDSVPRKSAAAIPSADRALDLVGKASSDPKLNDSKLNRDLTETTAAVIQSAGTLAKAVDRGEPTGHLQPLPRLTPPGLPPLIPPANPGSALNGVAEALQGAAEDLVGQALGPVAANSPASVLQPAGGLPGVGSGALPPRRIPPSVPLAGSPSGGRDLGSPLMQRPVDFGGPETPRRPQPMSRASSSAGTGALRLAARALRLVPVSAAAIDSAGEGPANHHAPLDGNSPKPLPSSPQGEVSGAGGSSFVPIAALLALLALAAPAIFRRLGERADFRAPTPFVCALERPG